jgi:ABC-type transporter Mla subunit MlaD
VDRLVGLVIVVALILVAATLVRHFRDTGSQLRHLAYHTLLSRSYGIAKGADIRLAGISIGKVSEITLQANGKVRLELRIAPEHQGFVTRGSYLQVASSMGLAALVDLTQLRFITNSQSEELLPQGAFIETAEPADLAESLNADEIEKIAVNVKTILVNLADLSEAMARNQDLVTSSLTNVNRITVEVHQALQALPRLWILPPAVSMPGTKRVPICPV